MESDPVSENPHDVVSVGSETNDQQSRSVNEGPDGNVGLLSSDSSRTPDVVDNGERSDRI